MTRTGHRTTRNKVQPGHRPLTPFYSEQVFPFALCTLWCRYHCLYHKRSQTWCVWVFFRFYPFFLTLSVKTLFFRIKQINCTSLSDSFFPHRTVTNLLLGFIIMCLQLSVCLSVKNRATFSIGICIWLHFLISHLCTV